MTPRKLPLELTPAEFRERIKMIVGLPRPSVEDRPCVRKPGDHGYFKTQTEPTQKEPEVMRYHITEEATYTIEAETPKAALALFMRDLKAPFEVAIHERDIIDDDGNDVTEEAEDQPCEPTREENLREAWLDQRHLHI